MYLNRRMVSMSGLINLRDIFYFELHGSCMYVYYAYMEYERARSALNAIIQIYLIINFDIFCMAITMKHYSQTIYQLCCAVCVVRTVIVAAISYPAPHNLFTNYETCSIIFVIFNLSSD